MFMFGLITLFQGFVHNYSGLLATRFFLGVFEAGNIHLPPLPPPLCGLLQHLMRVEKARHIPRCLLHHRNVV